MTVVVADAMSLALFGSYAGLSIRTALLSRAVSVTTSVTKPGSTSTSTVIVAVSSTSIEPRAQVSGSSASPGVPPVHEPCEGVMDRTLTPAGSASVTTTPSARPPMLPMSGDPVSYCAFVAVIS